MTINVSLRELQRQRPLSVGALTFYNAPVVLARTLDGVLIPSLSGRELQTTLLSIYGEYGTFQIDLIDVSQGYDVYDCRNADTGKVFVRLYVRTADFTYVSALASAIDWHRADTAYQEGNL